jgi:hypothetical protein
MPDRQIQDDPQVVEGEDDLPRQPQTTHDPYRPHFRNRPAWASRGKILLWAWLPIVVIVAAVIWAFYH